MIRKQALRGLMVCWLLVSMPAAVVADKQPTSDQVSFEVEVDREVDNDHVVALLTVDMEDRDPAQLADDVNRAMAWALQLARADTAVSTRTGSYQTYPVYDDRRIVRWRARQELYLESAEVEHISRLAGQLQERLQVQSLRFSVSDDRRREVQEHLVTQALEAYQKRAELVARALGAKGYQLISVAVQTGERDHVHPLRAEAASMVSRAAVTPPAMESGTSRVAVQVSGSIRLLR